MTSALDVVSASSASLMLSALSTEATTASSSARLSADGATMCAGTSGCACEVAHALSSSNRQLATADFISKDLRSLPGQERERKCGRSVRTQDAILTQRILEHQSFARRRAELSLAHHDRPRRWCRAGAVGAVV